MKEEYNLPLIQVNLEEKEYIHRNKYRSLYLRLIEKGLNMTEEELSGYNEKHHILPKCMGGTDDKSNLVLLPVRYHIMAHLLLLEAYPNIVKIAITASLMINGSTSNGPMKKRTEILEKSFSTRTLSYLREKAKKLISGENSPLLGGNNPNSKGVINPEGKVYKSIKEASKDTGIPYSTLTKWLSGNTISNHGWSYQNGEKTVYKNRNLEASSKLVSGPNGIIYSSIKNASDLTKIPYTTLRYWLSGRTKDNHGWNFV